MTKTTRSDFLLFKDCVKEYQIKLGLTDWKIAFTIDSSLVDAYASTSWNLRAYIATMFFTGEWDDMIPKNYENIRRIALHEILHLLMAPLTNEARERYTTESLIESIEHNIIRRLENIV